MGTANPHPLLAARRKAGLTQEQLAVRAGITSKTVRAIERREWAPQESTRRALAVELGLDPEELLEAAA